MKQIKINAFIAAAAAVLCCAVGCGGKETGNSIPEIDSYENCYTLAPDAENVTNEQLDEAKQILTRRLINMNIEDRRVYVDQGAGTIGVAFNTGEFSSHWSVEELEAALCEKREVTFRIGLDYEPDKDGSPIPKGEIRLDNKDISSVQAVPDTSNGIEGSSGNCAVNVEFNEEGAKKFAEVTGELAGSGTPLSIWLDNTMLSAPKVANAIYDGNAIITGSFTNVEANRLALAMDSDALPFALKITDRT